MRQYRLRWMSVLFGASLFAVSTMVLPSAQGQESRNSELLAKMLESLDGRKGLVVVLGSQDGKLAIDLSRDGQNLVHGLCTTGEAVRQARKAIDASSLRGVVSAETGSMKRLPYSDNIVNLAIVENTEALLQDGLQFKEVMRVLRPGGTAWLEGLGDRNEAIAEVLTEQLDGKVIASLVTVDSPGKTWLRLTKPRPTEMDAWTHPRGKASGNPVSTDTQVGVPSGVRWVAGPNWPTSDRKASTPAAVASKEHLAVIFQDEIETSDGTVQEDSLIVRDVFNGLRLWRRKADSADLLAADGLIYTKVAGKLVALDGDTGTIEHAYNVKGPGEFLLSNGMLVVAGSDGITAFDSGSHDRIWNAAVQPKKMRAGSGRLFVHIDNSRRGRASELECYELKTGNRQWNASTQSWAKEATFDLILYSDGVLVCAAKDGNHAVSSTDGSHLWHYKYALIGHGGSFAKVMASTGLIWIHTADSQGSKQYAWEGLDPQTGKIAKRILQPKEFTYKHRCSYDVGTEQLFLCGSMDFADLKTGEYHHFGASRTSCRTAGLIPANGLIYTFPHACGCYAMLRGFLALETQPLMGPTPSAAGRLERGPRYGIEFEATKDDSTDWPMYRRDIGRSGSTSAAGPTELKELWHQTAADRVPASVALEWNQKDGGRLTSPVVAGGLAFVASSDHHQLHTFDSATGEPRWKFTTGGRIDCPPTIDGGLCLFGSHDGYVYCLSADTGELVWRFQGAPYERRIVAYGQIESARPVVGGVLVYDGLAHFVVGRHSASDGGLLVQAVRPETGELVWAEQVTGHDGTPDVLTGGNGTIQLASWEVDSATGKPKSGGIDRLRGGRLGLLNDAWYKRPIAIRRNLSQWKSADRPTGQMLAFNDAATCGYRACEKVNTGNGTMSGNAQLFAKAASGKEWKLEMPTTARMRGMVIAGDRLYVAGLLYEDEKGKGANNGVRVYSLANGKMLAEHTIEDRLVHDCLAVADGRLYVSTEDGRLICLGTE